MFGLFKRSKKVQIEDNDSSDDDLNDDLKDASNEFSNDALKNVSNDVLDDLHEVKNTKKQHTKSVVKIYDKNSNPKTHFKDNCKIDDIKTVKKQHNKAVVKMDDKKSNPKTTIKNKYADKDSSDDLENDLDNKLNDDLDNDSDNDSESISDNDSESQSESHSENDLEELSDITSNKNFEPKFVSPFSNDNFMCKNIVLKSEREEYQYNESLEELLNDMKKCIAYDDKNDRFFIKDKSMAQIVPRMMYDSEAKKYLSTFNVKYTKDGHTEWTETNLYNLMKKYRVVCNMSYSNVSFYNPIPRKDVLYVFYKWKYNALPEKQDVNMKLISPFLDLCENVIFPTKRHINQFYCWVANILQNPGILNGFGYYIFGKPGTGKSTLINFIAELTHGYSIPNVDNLNSVFGDFNSRREFNVFIGINDVKEDKPWEKLKTPITEKEFECSTKNRESRTAENVNNIIICTNYEFMIEDYNDRRWQVIKIKDTRINDKKYFKTLYDMLYDEEAMQHLYTFFIRYNLEENYRDIQVIDGASSTNRYSEFIKWYRQKHHGETFTEDYLKQYWDEKQNLEQLIGQKILKIGEPPSSLYAQFRHWATIEGCVKAHLPTLLEFSKDIVLYEDVSKKGNIYLKSGRKTEKIRVIHFPRTDVS